MKNDSPVKKHHFWILLGVVPLLTLIGVLTVSSRVGGEIAKRKADIKAANDKIQSKMNPVPTVRITETEKQVAKVSARQGGLHKDNWDRQKHLYTWPANSKLLREIEYGEANIDKNVEPINDLRVQRALENVPQAGRAAAFKKMQDDWAKLNPAGRTANVRAYLAGLSAADRKAALEPAWPKFGDPLPTDRGEFDEFRARGNEVYLPEFSTLLKKDAIGPGTGMADKVAPTQFRGGWENVLRHVNNWGTVQLTKDQVWLIMEDIWVQRSLLEGVRSVNEEMATFRRAVRDKNGNIAVDPWFDEQGYKLDKDGKRVATPDEEKTKALFRNRTWGLDLELVKDGNDLYLGGTLTNLTDRLQLMGTNNTMLLKVWFSKDAAAQPMIFRVGGEFLPGVGSKKTIRVDMRDQVVDANVLPIVRVPDQHRVPATLNAVEIVRVEQVFDVRTVPIKQINAMELGKLDSRYAAVQLVTPSFIKETAPAAPADGGMNGPGGMGPGGPPPGMGGGPPPMPGGPGPGAGGGQSSTKGKASGGGTVADVIDGNRRRYLPDPANPDKPMVRRMPVAIVVVVDQAYMQDVQLAFANSPLRFQITQVTWRRYRGELAGTGTSGGTTNTPGSDIDIGTGSNNIMGSGDPDARPGGNRPPAPPGPGPMGGPPPMPGAGPGPGPGLGGSPGSYGPAATVSESQITSGLVELSIYGIVSLYEKFEAPKVDGAPPASGPNPNPAPPQPAPVGVPPTGTPPKPRRSRARR